MKKRKSYHLARLKDELRKRALREDDEEKRRDYWRLYYKANHAEHEVREMVLDAEMRRLLEFVFPNGLPHGWADESADPPKKPKAPDEDTPIDDGDIPPRQKGLWE